MLRHRLPVLLRLTTLGTRFLLIFLLARLLPAAEVGLYGLLAAMSGYAVIALGFDFYTHSTREMIREPQSRWRTFLRSQVTFSGLLYLVGYPVILLLFVFDLMPWHMVWWFIILVPLEHLGLEIDRILIAMSDQLGASVGMFFRQATTPLLVIPLMWVAPGLRTLDVVLWAWVVFDVLGIAVGLLFLSKHLRNQPRGTVDWRWIRVGATVAIPFIIGTLCLRALFTLDRQIVATLADLTVLGAYTLFMSIAAGMTQVISAGVHQFIYPRLVATAHANDRLGYYASLKKLTIQTIVVAMGISITVMLTEPLLLRFVDDEIYVQFSWMLPWAMLVTGVYNLSLIPHFGLYALDADRTILLITVAAFGAFLAVVALSPAPVVARILTALASATLILLVGKAAALIGRLRGRPFDEQSA